jgi:hypothetical protein
MAEEYTPVIPNFIILDEGLQILEYKSFDEPNASIRLIATPESLTGTEEVWGFDLVPEFLQE